jgi:hypothetical protein
MIFIVCNTLGVWRSYPRLHFERSVWAAAKRSSRIRKPPLMNLSAKQLKLIRDYQIDLERRFEALEDWLNIHYTRLPSGNDVQAFPAEYHYKRKPRKFFARQNRNAESITGAKRKS